MEDAIRLHQLLGSCGLTLSWLSLNPLDLGWLRLRAGIWLDLSRDTPVVVDVNLEPVYLEPVPLGRGAPSQVSLAHHEYVPGDGFDPGNRLNPRSV